MSVRPSTSFAVLLVILLGFMVGFWAGGFWPVTTAPISSSSASSDAAHDAAPEVALPGWCCKQAGGSCVEESEGVIVCLQGGGLLFNLSRQTCDTVCGKL